MKKKYIHCTVQINASDISRRNIDGVEHVTISSMTLPDDIVMNGGLYPADEIDKSFKSLEGTLAPLEHPVNANGEFLSATDPKAIRNFFVGASNENVEKVNGRIKIDKIIDVPFAMRSDKGKRLMDRIHELETSSDPRPIHTSVGVFLEPKFLDEPRVNAAGDEYTWIARNMVFDHDAILLDNVGAAQPHQGVGIGVNAKGQKYDTEFFVLNNEKPPTSNQKDENMKTLILNALKEAKVSTDGLDDDQLLAAYNKLTANSDESEEIKTLKAEIKANADKKAKDEAEAKANAENDGDGGDPKIEDVIANIMKPLTDQMATLTSVVNKTADEEVDNLVDGLSNHDAYKAISKDELKKLDVNTLKTMTSHIAPSYGINGHMANNNGADDEFAAPTEAPE